MKARTGSIVKRKPRRKVAKVTFHPSAEATDRVADLILRDKTTRLSFEEKSEPVFACWSST